MQIVFVVYVIMCLNNCSRGSDLIDLPVNRLNAELDINDSCDYVNVDNKLTCEKDSLKCVQMNVRGITSKKTEIMHLIDNCLYIDTLDVLLLCEISLTPFSPVLNILGYETYQCNRIGKKGGGVAILLTAKYRCKVLNIKY